MTAAEVIGTIREHLEGQFPKVCSVCKRSYVNFVVMTHVSDFEFRISKPKCLCLKWAVDVVYAPPANGPAEPSLSSRFVQKRVPASICWGQMSRSRGARTVAPVKSSVFPPHCSNRRDA